MDDILSSTGRFVVFRLRFFCLRIENDKANMQNWNHGLSAIKYKRHGYENCRNENKITLYGQTKYHAQYAN